MKNQTDISEKKEVEFLKKCKFDLSNGYFSEDVEYCKNKYSEIYASFCVAQKEKFMKECGIKTKFSEEDFLKYKEKNIKIYKKYFK